VVLEAEEAFWVGFRQRVEWDRRVGRKKLKGVGLRSSGEGGGNTREASMRLLSTNIFLVRVLVAMDLYSISHCEDSM
jgi:hypothetical protein